MAAVTLPVKKDGAWRRSNYIIDDEFFYIYSILQGKKNTGLEHFMSVCVCV